MIYTKPGSASGRPDPHTSEFQPRSQRRREHERHRVELDVSSGSDHNFYSGFAENLSTAGVFVATHLLKKVGEHVDISIHLAELDKLVQGTGEVCWVREPNERSDMPPGMGIRFVELLPGSAEAIEQFLATRESGDS